LGSDGRETRGLFDSESVHRTQGLEVAQEYEFHELVVHDSYTHLTYLQIEGEKGKVAIVVYRDGWAIFLLGSKFIKALFVSVHQ
jgi:hypothetical protein